MKKLTAAFAISIALVLAGCGFLGSGEAVKHDSSGTVYRAAETSTDVPDVADTQQQVPGEKRSKTP